MTSCQVNAAIERALADGAADYAEQGIIVTRSLDATIALATDEPVLEQALYTIFRGLPARLVRGATLLVSTRDRAGGDIELVWEARELDVPPPAGAGDRSPLARGQHGDLLELAVRGLESICRARGGHEDRTTRAASSSNFLKLAPHVRRRYLFLIPSLRRASGGYPHAT